LVFIDVMVVRSNFLLRFSRTMVRLKSFMFYSNKFTLQKDKEVIKLLVATILTARLL